MKTQVNDIPQLYNKYFYKVIRIDVCFCYLGPNLDN